MSEPTIDTIDTIDSTDPIEPGGIAIVGMAGRFPAARNPAELWNLLKAGREATQWLTDEELRVAGVSDTELADPNYVRASLVLPDMEMFDAEFFGFSKRDAAILDPQHRHFIECAWEALEDAGHPPEKFDGAIGVFAGCGMQAYLPYNLLTNPELRKSVGLFLLRHTGNDKDFLTTRVSYLLDLKGPSVGIQTACSTSLVAVHVAAQSLLAGECDMALAGASSIELPHRQGYRFAEGEIMSPDGHCRAFDESASGTLFGSGAAVVVLRRLEDAVRDRDNIYAVIRGSAVNNDGSQKAGYLAPSVDGQARAAVEALAVANVEPGSVQYIEAHGTGTPVGDPIEIAALTQAYGAGGTGFCGIGSLKTNIGHLDTAAGVASLIKVSLALRHQLIPATLNFSRPNSRFDLDKTPFQVMAQPKIWPRSAAPRRAAVNSLGVGGTNAHVIVEEPPRIASIAPAQTLQVLALSARTPASLDRLKARWSDFLADAPADFSIADAAFTTQEGRRGFAHRCAIVARDVQELASTLEIRNSPRVAAGKAGTTSPQVVMMFPGGGASYAGAGRELLSQRAFRFAADECFQLMPADAPADLRSVMFDRAPGDAQAQAQAVLEQPRYNIPALFVLEYSIARLWESWGVRPSAVIGHSAGEYAAAVIAGVMSLADALSVTVLRGQLFEQIPPGSMLSVDLPEAQLRSLLTGLELDIGVINAADLCTVSGAAGPIVELEKRLALHGREGRRLRINVAAHSRLLDGILERFRQGVSRIRLSQPALPFISNLSGSWADHALLSDPEYWVRQLRQPVRFADGLAKALELGDAVLLEVGPGQSLCSLARQNLQGQARTVLPSTGKPQEAGGDAALMLTSLGALWARGLTPDWGVVRGGGAPRRISLPTYAFDHRRHWIEPGKLTHEEAVQQEAVPQALRRLPLLDDWFSVPQWSPAPLPNTAATNAAQWLVLGSDGPLAAGVLRRISEEAGQTTLVRHGARFHAAPDGGYTINCSDAAQFEQLFAALDQAGRLPDHIVHLWGLETQDAAGGCGLLQGQALAFDSLVHLARALQTMDVRHSVRLTVTTAGSQAVNGQPVLHPVRSLALGPCRVIPREVPNVSTVLLDLDPGSLGSAQASRAIVAESLGQSGADLVAWRGGSRWVVQLVKPAATAQSRRKRVRQGGVYLITGGLGDIALELADFLASRHHARLALVSRRSLPDRSAWTGLAQTHDDGETARLVRKLLAIEAAGGQVAVYSADVASVEGMTRVVQQVRQRWSAINGVFHAAGTLQDAPIAAKTAQAMRAVLSPKAAGAQVLHELLPPGELDVFAMFSSTSVHIGPPGQVDYVAANAFLDAIAAARPDGLAIHWGIWADTGMAARAYGRVAGLPPPLGGHPLLGVQVDGEAGTAFEATYSAQDLWVLREHAVAGRPVLPGTAYIEIARAAMAQLHPGAGVEIRSLSFEEAMVFDAAGSRQVRIELRRNRDHYQFLVRSRGQTSESWQEHARATVSRFNGPLPPSTQRNVGTWQGGGLPQDGVAFGPRWNNIARMQLKGRRGVAEMALPEQFATDLQPYALHPAVTDIAATFGLHLLEPRQRKESLFVPMSVDRIRIVAPMPLRSISRVELKGPAQDRFAAFDVALHTPEGAPIATFEGFSLRGIDPQAISRHAATQASKEPSLAEAMLACGLRAQEAPALFERILCGAARDVVVSSLSLSAVRRAMSDAAPKPLPVAAIRAPMASGNALNPVESVIAEVWRELLGVDEVGLGDDFFALGGHSLAAVRLFARIRKQWSVDLPLATLFQSSTLGGLSALVAQAGKLDTAMRGAQVPATPPSSNVIQLPRAWSPLVAICRGAPELRPVFCVHGAGGNVLNFKVISDRLGPQQPFYGLQAQGVDGRTRPLSSVEAMAAQYIEAIRSVDANGPYRLAGYSGGGVIAYEMAQQFKRAGAEVDTILMIDTLEPTAAARKLPLWKKIWLKRHWTREFAIDWPTRRRRDREMQRNYQLALEKLARGEPLPPELVDIHLFRNFTDAQAQYKPQRYDGDVMLIKAELAETIYLHAGPYLGWNEYVAGDIRFTEISGSHFTMMAEPGISKVIEAFRRELTRLDGDDAVGTQPSDPRVSKGGRSHEGLNPVV
jgi:acyl transferase domain-containing protein/thioesterase domain-containing protein